MNLTRILILVGALFAAGLAAFLARGLMGGQNQAEAATNLEATEIVVAARSIEVGTKIMPGDLKWQGWPKSALDASFITKEARPQALEDSAQGSVARIPLVVGEPVTDQKVIKADGAGFMAAMLTPGMRGVGVKLSAERGAGGFILPNDRVDVIMTRKRADNDGGVTNYESITVLSNVRVLAVDQTSQEEGDSKAIVGKTATLEVNEGQAEELALAEAMGDLSLSLRSLQQTDKPVEAEGQTRKRDDGRVGVLRYGIPSSTATTNKE